MWYIASNIFPSILLRYYTDKNNDYLQFLTVVIMTIIHGWRFVVMVISES